MDRSHERKHDSNSKPAAAAKPPYRKPVLQVYGSVGKLTLGSVGSVGDAGGKSMSKSHPAYKQGIVRVGDHPLGIGLYLFEYRPEYRARFGEGRRFGVMADEVAAVMPGVVSRDADGFVVVDYARLGVFPAVH